MARSAFLLAVLACPVGASAGDSLVERWDRPKRESFEMRLAWPEHVVEALTERYGVPFELDAPGIERGDFVAKDVTFFEALDRFAAAHGLGIAGAPGSGPKDWGPNPLKVVRLPEGTRVVPAAYLGASRLSIQRVSLLAVVRCAPMNANPLPGGDAEDAPRLHITFRWIVEPGFDRIALVSWRVTAAEDDLGGALRLLEGPDGPVAPTEDFAMRLGPPSAKATSIRRLEGVARVVLPSEKGKVEFLAAEKGKTKTLGGAEVTFDGVDEARNAMFTVVGTPCAGARADADVDMWVGDGLWPEPPGVNTITMRPYDGEGKEIGMGTSMESTVGEGRSTFKIELEAVPARIALEAFVSGIEREALFAFANIPLPD